MKAAGFSKTSTWPTIVREFKPLRIYVFTVRYKMNF